MAIIYRIAFLIILFRCDDHKHESRPHLQLTQVDLRWQWEEARLQSPDHQESGFARANLPPGQGGQRKQMWLSGN
jgi:hypothetical protein